MRIPDVVSMLGGNLARRKGRTLLTLIGVVIGVTALVLMISLALALEREILKLFETEDSLRTITITRLRSGHAGRERPEGPWDMLRAGPMAVPITDQDLAEVARLPGVAAVIPEFNLILTMEIEGERDATQPYVPIGGLPPEEVSVMRKYLLAGDVWTDPSERAVLIPSRLLSFRVQKKPEEIVGKYVIFSRPYASEDTPPPGREEVRYRVAGVIDTERLGIMARHLYVPMQRGFELRELMQGGMLAYKKGTYLSADVKAIDANALRDVRRQLENSGYMAISAADITAMMKTVFFVIEGFMACIGAIGLIVSVFGIANTMMMAVLERTREIGIMKAVGARNRDIRRIFLLEAGSIGLIGGLIGLALGAGGGLLLNFLAHQWVKQIPPDIHLFHVSLWLAVGSLAFSIFVSTVAGFMPALRASRLDPVRALRYE